MEYRILHTPENRGESLTVQMQMDTPELKVVIWRKPDNSMRKSQWVCVDLEDLIVCPSFLTRTLQMLQKKTKKKKTAPYHVQMRQK